MENTIDIEPIEQTEDSSMDIDGDSYLLEFLDDVLAETEPETNLLGSIDDVLVESELEIVQIITTAQPTKIAFPSNTVLDKKPEEEETCCICMDTFYGTRNTTLKCGHKFHTDCILGNISSATSNKHKCPLCRDEMCPEISVKEVDDLKEQMEVLEDALHDRHVRMNHYRNALYYFYDENDELFERCDKNLLKIKQMRKQNKNYFSNIKTLQDKLSAEIVKNKSDKNYKKCSFCNKYGHNSSTCSRSPIRERVLKTLTGLRIEHRYREQLRPSHEIIKAIMPDGELYEAINEHFE